MANRLLRPLRLSFQPLKQEAIDILSASTGIDFSQAEFSDENTWFCCTVYDVVGRVMLVIVFEFKNAFDAHFSLVVVDKRALTRSLITAIYRALFRKAARVTALIDPENHVALRQVWRMGFKYEGYVRRGLDGTRDGVMFGLLPEDCPYLTGEPFVFNTDPMIIHPEHPGVN